MNAPHSPRPTTAAVVVRSLLWLWLICLSIFVFLNHRVMSDLADREPVDSGLRHLETQVAGLAENMRQQPEVATATDLQDTRRALEARIARVEQALDGHAAMDDLQALRAEVDQIKARQAMDRSAALAQPHSPSRSTAAKPEPPPLPFRVVGAELRAGQRSVSVAPATNNFTADQVQVLLPGDVVGPWRLQAIEGNTAVFQAGEQVRRVAIP